MGRLIEAFAQFFDGNGDPLAYGWLRFLASSSNNTPKDTYNDPDYQIPNPNPLQLDAEGRCPSVFGIGEYRIISYVNDPDEEDSPGEQIQMFDPVTSQGTLEAIGGSGAAFDAWVDTVTYDLGDIVVRDLDYYRSLVNSNFALDPLLETYAWEQIDFLRFWNSEVSYTTGDLVYYDENLYLSLADSNLGNVPTTSPAWWRAVATGCKGFSHQTTDYTITSTEREYLIVLTSAATADATFDLPAMSSNTDKFCLWIYNASDYVLTIDAAGSAGIWLNTSGTIELTGGCLIQLGYNSYLDCWLPVGGSVGPTLGNQDVGTSSFPILNLYSTGISTSDLTTTGAVSSALATIDELHIPSDGPIYFGDADEVSMIYDSTGTEFNLSVDSGVDITFVNNSVDYWSFLSTGQIIPGASNPLPDLGTASYSLNFIYTDNISFPDNGYALFGGGDDLGITVTGAASSISSSLPLNIGTSNTSIVTIFANSSAGIVLNSDLSVNFYNGLSILDTTASLSLGNSNEFSIYRSTAAGPTYVNSTSIGGLYFQESGSTVMQYSGSTVMYFYKHLYVPTDTYMYFGDYGTIRLFGGDLKIDIAGGGNIDFNISSSNKFTIGTNGMYPGLPNAYQIGDSSYYLEALYTSKLIGDGTSLTFGLSDSSTFEITNVLEYQDGSLNWHMAIAIEGVNGTYTFYSDLTS